MHIPYVFEGSNCSALYISFSSCVAASLPPLLSFCNRVLWRCLDEGRGWIAAPKVLSTMCTSISGERVLRQSTKGPIRGDWFLWAYCEKSCIAEKSSLPGQLFASPSKRYKVDRTKIHWILCLQRGRRKGCLWIHNHYLPHAQHSHTHFPVLFCFHLLSLVAVWQWHALISLYFLFPLVTMIYYLCARGCQNVYT